MLLCSLEHFYQTLCLCSPGNLYEFDVYFMVMGMYCLAAVWGLVIESVWSKRRAYPPRPWKHTAQSLLFFSTLSVSCTVDLTKRLDPTSTLPSHDPSSVISVILSGSTNFHIKTELKMNAFTGLNTHKTDGCAHNKSRTYETLLSHANKCIFRHVYSGNITYKWKYPCMRTATHMHRDSISLITSSL